MNLPDRYIGCLLGLAAGDALGTTLEFRKPGSFEPISDMTGGGPFNLAPGEWTDDTEWFRVTAWERQAESVNQYLAKGRRVFVDGRLSTRQYTSNSGEARTSLEVRAFKVVFLDSPGGESTGAGAPPEAQSYSAGPSAPQGQQDPAANNPTEDVEELPW